jgi:hypothetical protein
VGIILIAIVSNAYLILNINTDPYLNKSRQEQAFHLSRYVVFYFPTYFELRISISYFSRHTAFVSKVGKSPHILIHLPSYLHLPTRRKITKHTLHMHTWSKSKTPRMKYDERTNDPCGVRVKWGNIFCISTLLEYWSKCGKWRPRFVTKFGINESSTLRFSVLINETAAIPSCQLTRALSIKTDFGF